MTTRITGLATGLDIDSLVSAELSSYNSKITKQQQNKEILEIQQEMYRDVITKGSDFYTKYLDRTKEGNLISSSAYATTVFSSSNENAVTVKAVSGAAIKDNYTVSVEKLAAPASVLVDISKFKNLDDKKIYVTVNGQEQPISIDISSIIDSDKSDKEKNSALVSALNNNLNSFGLKAVYSEISGGVILKSEKEGANQSFTISDKNKNMSIEGKGVDCEYTISSSSTGVTKSFTSSSNTVTLDGIEFSFTSKTSEPVTITGKTDASTVVDQIVNFFDDYNTMITSFQTFLTEKHDRDYAPLTEEQKSEMTDSQITKWEAKVKQGQLRNDNLVQSLVNQMRSAITTNAAALKKIGIETTKEYGVKAGTVTVDKDKLKAAIEEDPDAVMKLFIAAETTKEVDGKQVAVSGTGGVFTSLKNVIYDNTISTTKSSLIAKAGTATYNTNATITKQINKYAKTISQMQSTLATKEQKLYSKYSSLETIMNKYNTQLSNLQSYFS